VAERFRRMMEEPIEVRNGLSKGLLEKCPPAGEETE
jgi:hypothetical protein